MGTFRGEIFPGVIIFLEGDVPGGWSCPGASFPEGSFPGWNFLRTVTRLTILLHDNAFKVLSCLCRTAKNSYEFKQIMRMLKFCELKTFTHPKSHLSHIRYECKPVPTHQAPRKNFNEIREL